MCNLKLEDITVSAKIFVRGDFLVTCDEKVGTTMLILYRTTTIISGLVGQINDVVSAQKLAVRMLFMCKLTPRNVRLTFSAPASAVAP